MDQLGLFETKKDAPEVDQLIRFLDGRGWMTATEISEATGMTDRKIRSIAHATPKILSYPGSPGYRLTRQATADERDRGISVLNSQANSMKQRAIDIAREHRFGSPTQESELFGAKTSAYGNGL